MTVIRDDNGIAHIIGLSFGKDSVCMSLALREKEPRPYTYVCTPTGDELPDMVQHMLHVESLLGSTVIKLTNGTLASQIESNRMLPSHHARWCTRLLKLKPFGKFMEEHAPCVAYVGLRDDEDEREGTQPGGDSAAVGTRTQQDFPFRRWGWGLSEVWSFLRAKGVTIPDRTDCARCPYQRLAEWYLLWKNNLSIYLDAENDELRWGHTYRSPKKDKYPAGLAGLREMFESGWIPKVSLKRLENDRELALEGRDDMCRKCSM